MYTKTISSVIYTVDRLLSRQLQKQNYFKGYLRYRCSRLLCTNTKHFFRYLYSTDVGLAFFKNKIIFSLPISIRCRCRRLLKTKQLEVGVTGVNSFFFFLQCILKMLLSPVFFSVSRGAVKPLDPTLCPSQYARILHLSRSGQKRHPPRLL